MALTRLGNGIYSKDGNVVSGKGRPILLVHPYYGENSCQPLDDKWNQYLENLRSLLQQNRPLVVMEERHQFDRTYGRLVDSARSDGMYFIDFSCFGWWPRDIGWNEVADFLASFEGRPLTAGGGYYSSNGHGGCLNSAVAEIRKARPDIEIDVSAEVTF